MKTKIISAFPGTGKSYYHELNKDTTLDSDSSLFSWTEDKRGQKIRDPLFPANYIAHIKKNFGSVEFIFVSSHAEVRKALREAGFDFILCYPKLQDKVRYMRRYKDRGSSQAFLDLLDKNWDSWIKECQNETGCVNMEMRTDSISDEMRYIKSIR